MARPSFRTAFDPKRGEAVEVAKNILRITAPNKGAFTFHGTNSYLVGDKKLTLIDPGPEGHENHFDTLMKAIDGRELTHILVTHTHVDHSPLSRRIAKLTGAKIFAEGPHRSARKLHLGETNFLDASGDKAFQPDVILKDGDVVDAGEIAFEAVFTPGHTSNHMAFGICNSDMLFSGDHVMSWATTIVAPPDGSMSDYMDSLDKLAKRNEHVYFPGHGGKLEKAIEFVRALKAHRRMREIAILDRFKKGDRTIPEVVAVIYKETNKRLHGAAALSVFAHIEDLIAKDKLTCEGPPSLESEYHPV